VGAKLHYFLQTIMTNEIREEGEDDEDEDEEWIWRKGSHNLRRFKELITDSSRAQEFKNTLGPPQLASWNLLQEWLGAVYQPSGLSEAARNAIDDNLCESKRRHGIPPEISPSGSHRGLDMPTRII